MYAENGQRREDRPDADRLYALLYRLGADLRRQEALLRAIKKQLEERENT